MRRNLFTSLLFTGFVLAAAPAFADDTCDPATSAALGGYLGEVFCRGAYLADEPAPQNCPEAITACQEALAKRIADLCPTAKNDELYKNVMEACELPPLPTEGQ